MTTKTKRPNKMGRIEADPKPKRSIPWKKTLYVVVAVLLVTLGVAGTLRYQAFINDVKAEGVAEFTLNKCDKYSDKDGNQHWLECDL